MVDHLLHITVEAAGARAVALAGALVALGFLGIQGALLGRLVAATGAVLFLTGLVGWCPMCAMAGRKLG